MIIEHFAVGPLACNCTIIGDPATGEALVFDPGGDAPHILSRLATLQLRCVGIVHTHAHFDHVGATYEVQQDTQAPVMLHQGDLFLYNGLQMQLDAFGMPFKAPPVAEIDRFLVDDSWVRAGAAEVEVLHTPGHTPGSLCFSMSSPDQPVVIAGDTLFCRSIGRSDLWGGDGEQLLASIRTRLLTLDDNTLVITGHGAPTTIGAERRGNPYLR